MEYILFPLKKLLQFHQHLQHPVVSESFSRRCRHLTVRAPFWLFESLYTGRSRQSTKLYQTISVASSTMLFWTEKNSRSPVTILFPLERPKSRWATQGSALQIKNCRIIRLLILRGPNKLILQKPKQLKAPSSPPRNIQPSHLAAEGQPLKVTISRPISSVALAPTPDLKKEPLQVTRNIHLYCRAVPRQSLPPLPTAHAPNLLSTIRKTLTK